jgi:hypothetical protein
MGQLYDAIDQRWRDWIAAQHLFFVSTAPSEGGHVNNSPKGVDSFRVLGDREVAYLDLIGSGAETIAHIRENGRVTVMFCAFQGPPMILRLYGRGEVCEPGQPDWDALVAQFPDFPNARSVIRIHVDRIQDSCGYGIPLMDYREERTQMEAWAAKKGADGLREYQLENNLESVDGLPALRGDSLR